MLKEQRKHQRNPASGDVKIQTSLSGRAYTVSLRDISKGGAFLYSTHLPEQGESISFEILDEYGLRMIAGHGRIVRVTSRTLDSVIGFAIQFDKELDQAMLDYLWALQTEEVI